MDRGYFIRPLLCGPVSSGSKIKINVLFTEKAINSSSDVLFFVSFL